MAELNVKDRDLVAGDTWTFIRTYAGLPTGVTISKVYLTIKENETDLDAAAKVQKSITTSATADGQITDADSSGDGEIAFNIIIEASKSDDLTPEVDYFYDFQGIDSNGYVYTFEKGKITPRQGITDAAT